MSQATLCTHELATFYALHRPGDVHYAYIPHTCGHVWVDDYQLTYVEEKSRNRQTPWWKRLFLCDVQSEQPQYIRFKPAHHRVRLVYDRAFVSSITEDLEQKEAYTYATVPQWIIHVRMEKTTKSGYGYVEIKDIPTHISKLVFKLQGA